MTPGVNTNAVHKWMYINERKSICKMLICYMILYVLLFKRTESENFIFGSLHTPGLNCFNHAATHTKCQIPPGHQAFWKGQQTTALTSCTLMKFQTSCFFLLFIYLLCPINGPLSARSGQNTREREQRTLSTSKGFPLFSSSYLQIRQLLQRDPVNDTN